MARFLLLLAPIYWLSPFDFKPDFLPGGYTDDLWIVPSLFILGTKLIPQVVYIDARKTAKRAVCGFLCLWLAAGAAMLSARPHSLAELPDSSGMLAGTATLIPLIVSTCNETNISNNAAAEAIDLNQRRFKPRRPPDESQSGGQKPLLVSRCRLYRPSPSLILIHRGGQNQLYSTGEDALASPCTQIGGHETRPHPSLGGLSVCMTSRGFAAPC